MTEIVLFHSVLGVRQGVLDAAERLRSAGHTVHMPNLYESGVVFDDYAKAQAFVESIGGHPELVSRTAAAVRDLPNELVYAGFSNGGASAEYLCATRPGARGALLFSAALPLDKLLEWSGHEPAPWPAGVPVQAHYTVGDPFRDEEAWLNSFRDAVRASGALFEFHEYPGAGHLFTDRSLPSEYDASATEALWRHVTEFLAKLPAQ